MTGKGRILADQDRIDLWRRVVSGRLVEDDGHLEVEVCILEEGMGVVDPS